MAVDEPEALRVVFTLQLPRDPEESDVRNVTGWIDSLDKKVGPELSSAYRANSTMMVFECDKATWYALEGKEGFNFVGEVFGTNLRKQEQGALRELPTNKLFKAQRSPMGSGPGGRPGISPNVKSGWKHFLLWPPCCCLLALASGLLLAASLC